MATKRRRGDRWEYTIRRRGVLPKPLYLRFDTEEEGDRYCARMEALLDRGIVPEEIREPVVVRTLGQAIAQYIEKVSIPSSDLQLLDVLSKADRIGATRLTDITYRWAERWVEDMKRVAHHSPSTIRHYVGALARCLDWMARRETPELASGNPLRLLPKRYAM